MKKILFVLSLAIAIFLSNFYYYIYNCLDYKMQRTYEGMHMIFMTALLTIILGLVYGLVAVLGDLSTKFGKTIVFISLVADIIVIIIVFLKFMTISYYGMMLAGLLVTLLISSFIRNKK